MKNNLFPKSPDKQQYIFKQQGHTFMGIIP